MTGNRFTKGTTLAIVALSIFVFILIIGPGSSARFLIVDGLTPKSNPDFELNVTAEINLQKLKSYGLPIIIDFGSDACIPCKEMAPVLKELNAAFRGKAIIKFADVKKNPSLMKGFPVRLIPTQYFIGSDGKPFIPDDPALYMISYYKDKVSGEHLFTRHEGGLTKGQLISILAEMGVSI